MDAVLVLSLCFLICSVQSGLIRDDLIERALGLTFVSHDPGHVTTEADYYKIPPPYAVDTGVRQGVASSNDSCLHIRDVPTHLRSASNIRPSGLSFFYQKYTEAYRIPVVASSDVPDDAVRRACYVLRFLLADNPAVRQSYYAFSGRVAVIGAREGTVAIPEHSWLGRDWNQRTRGLGATVHAPASTAGEEDILCYRSDRYGEEDTLVNSLAHGIQLLGANRAIPGFKRRLENAFYQAKMAGLWAGTKATATPEEYFAEGTQSYFDVNANSPSPDGAHNHVNTREELRDYDPALYALIREVFPCGNMYIKRCQTTRGRESNENVNMDCDVSTGGEGTEAPNVIEGHITTAGTGTIGKASTNVTGSCQDRISKCKAWAGQGECISNPTYMHQFCRGSCGLCIPEDCRDARVDCHTWAARGECETNPAYMHYNCKLSCNSCDASCTDDNIVQCPQWSMRGECTTNSRYMLKSCRRSCGKC